ncbi:hypothetical protein ASD04_04405 [Devosia sp. Root436]|uniref:hypothetical protein n=1 Tax=Devosia sp. Root436 TaxID=1736537 RepID=UPI0007022E17|nr:hypothetical protein [Devosia sp. Root436]KQX39899.1 hypothetical protein ASD04_04405 [Devosia sp. Root436]
MIRTVAIAFALLTVTPAFAALEMIETQLSVPSAERVLIAEAATPQPKPKPKRRAVEGGASDYLVVTLTDAS